MDDDDAVVEGARAIRPYLRPPGRFLSRRC